jgi:hypothetical protein
MLSGLVALVIAGPVFWHSRREIYNYYWVGQVTGPERALRVSDFGALASVKWVFTQLLLSHVGIATLALGLGTAAVLRGLRMIDRTAPRRLPASPLPMRRAWATALIFLVAPAAVLAFHAVKAAAPVGIMAPAVVWVMVLACLQVARHAAPRVVAATSGAAVLAGLAVFGFAVSRNSLSAAEVRDAGKVNALEDYICYRAEECGVNRPRLAVTGIADGINAPSFRVLNYERHRQWMQIEETLPTGLFETTPAVVMAQLQRSDFICLVTAMDDVIWPFDRQLMSLLAVTRPWCEDNMRHVGDLKADGLTMSIYERRALVRPDGTSAVDFAALQAAAAGAPTRPTAVPPAPPAFPSPLRVLWSTSADCSYRLRAAYSPVRYGVKDLPDGLYLDERSGRIRGRFRRADTYTARITASNAAGSTTDDLAFQVEDQALVAEVAAPPTGAAGAPVEIAFAAFDAAGKLNFIDVTDLTTGTQTDRLEAGDEERQNWQGRYRMTLSQPGVHTILLRFVCYDPEKKDHYYFIDKTCEIKVSP